MIHLRNGVFWSRHQKPHSPKFPVGAFFPLNSYLPIHFFVDMGLFPQNILPKQYHILSKEVSKNLSILILASNFWRPEDSNRAANLDRSRHSNSSLSVITTHQCFNRRFFPKRFFWLSSFCSTSQDRHCPEVEKNWITSKSNLIFFRYSKWNFFYQVLNCKFHFCGKGVDQNFV